MSKAKHTPGPWTVSSSDPQAEFHEDGELLYLNSLMVSALGDGQGICSFEYDGSPISRDASVEEIKANASLIAAAPELFEAAQKALSRLEHYEKNLGSADADVMECLERAISKARGGAE